MARSTNYHAANMAQSSPQDSSDVYAKPSSIETGETMK